MLRKCGHLAGQLATAVFPRHQAKVTANYVDYFSKRWAGHSKWQNIKHTKQLQDKIKCVTFSRHAQKIIVAVKLGGPDVRLNIKLKSLVEEAKKLNMPNASIEKAIKSATATAQKPYWLVFSGPKGILIAFEVTTENIKYAQAKLAAQAKKHNFRLEKNTSQFITERGIIVSEPSENPEKAYDKALEDAIEVGVEDVFENEDKTLMFECYPNNVDVVHQKLIKKGYSIQSAGTEIEFTTYVKVSDEDFSAVNTLADKVQDLDDVIRVSYNVAQEQ